MGMGGGGAGALTGAAASLCAGAGPLHFPPLGQRGLIHILKAKSFSLIFVKGLWRKGWDEGHEDYSTQDSLGVLI